VARRKRIAVEHIITHRTNLTAVGMQQSATCT
jgi:hypothetical protein